MQFEIQKNTIIAILSALLIGAMVYIAFLLKMPPDCPELIIEEADPGSDSGNIYYSDPISSDKKLDQLVNETKELVDERDSLKEANILLKKKVVFYHEFYRVNQPVGITVAGNSWEDPGSWTSEPIEFDTISYLIYFLESDTLQGRIYSISNRLSYYESPDSLIIFGEDTVKLQLKQQFFDGRYYWQSDSLSLFYW